VFIGALTLEFLTNCFMLHHDIHERFLTCGMIGKVLARHRIVRSGTCASVRPDFFLWKRTHAVVGINSHLRSICTIQPFPPSHPSSASSMEQDCGLLHTNSLSRHPRLTRLYPPVGRTESSLHDWLTFQPGLIQRQHLPGQRPSPCDKQLASHLGSKLSAIQLCRQSVLLA